MQRIFLNTGAFKSRSLNNTDFCLKSVIEVTHVILHFLIVEYDNIVRYI